MKKIFEKLANWFESGRMSDLERLLSTAQNIADVEAKEREFFRRSQKQFF